MATVAPIKAAAATDGGWNLPTDAFAEILLRLPPSSQRRVRLVCRHWRDVVDERFPQLQSQPMAFVYVKTSTSGSAYVIEDIAEGRCRELWTSGAGRPNFNTVMVGTCNGLLCLCDNNRPAGGAIYLVNPVTGETLAVPRLPSSGHWARYEHHRGKYNDGLPYGWNQTYAFAYLPATGRYKLLHLPFHCDRTGGFNAVRVLTLGEPSWRDVPAPGASCRLDAGIVSVGSAAYWVTKGAETVMAFDLEDERVSSTGPVPVPPAGQGFLCHLTEVHRKLGLAISADKRAPAKTEVWVLGDGKDRQPWVRWCSVQVQGVPQRLARPHFAHGKYVLTTATAMTTASDRKALFVHRAGDAGRPLLRGEVRSVRIREPGTAVSGMGSDAGAVHRTFAYVETTEPLSDYRLKRTPAAVRRGRPLKQ